MTTSNHICHYIGWSITPVEACAAYAADAPQLSFLWPGRPEAADGATITTKNNHCQAWLQWKVESTPSTHWKPIIRKLRYQQPVKRTRNQLLFKSILTHSRLACWFHPPVPLIFWGQLQTKQPTTGFGWHLFTSPVVPFSLVGLMHLDLLLDARNLALARKQLINKPGRS